MFPAGQGAKMSHFTFNRKRAKLKKLLGIRARLALLALIVVAPLILDRARSLENSRGKQVAQAALEFSELAQHTADTQREVISSVETMLKSAAYIRASAGGVGHSCDIMRASLPINLPWINSLMIAGGEGNVQCATRNELVGLDLNGGAYFKKAQQGHDVVFSDFLFSLSNDLPIMMSAYPVAAIKDDSDAVIVAGISLNWLSKIMGNLGGRPGISAVLVDSTGVVLAAPPDTADTIGRSLDSIPLLSSIADQAIGSSDDKGSISFIAADGSRRIVNFARIPGTQSRLIISIDEGKVT